MNIDRLATSKHGDNKCKASAYAIFISSSKHFDTGSNYPLVSSSTKKALLLLL